MILDHRTGDCVGDSRIQPRPYPASMDPVRSATGKTGVLYINDEAEDAPLP